MALWSELKKLGWGAKYAIARTRYDFFSRTNSYARFTLTMITVSVLSALALYGMQEEAHKAWGLVAAIIVAILFLRSPDWILLPIVITVSTIFGSGSLPRMLARYLVGGTNVFDTHDLLLFGALFVGIWEYLALPKTERPRSSLMTPILGIYGVIVLYSMLYSLFIVESKWADIWNDLREVYPIFFAIPMMLLLRTPQRIKAFAIGLVVVMLITFVYFITMYLFPNVGGFAYSSVFGVSDTTKRGAGIAVRVPGTVMLIMTTIVCFSIYAFIEQTNVRRWLLALTTLFLIAVMTNKGRAGYWGVLLSLGITWLAAPLNAKIRILTHASALAIIIIPVLLFVPTANKYAMPIFEEAYTRFMQTFDEKEYRMGGMKARSDEIRTAMPSFYSNPLNGKGFGQAYGFNVENSRSNKSMIVPLRMIHNMWVWFLVRGGIILFSGLLLVLICWPLSIFSSLRRATTGLERGVCWGSFGFFLFIVITASVQPNFNYAPASLVSGLAMALPTLANRYVTMTAQSELKESDKPIKSDVASVVSAS